MSLGDKRIKPSNGNRLGFADGDDAFRKLGYGFPNRSEDTLYGRVFGSCVRRALECAAGIFALRGRSRKRSGRAAVLVT